MRPSGTNPGCFHVKATSESESTQLGREAFKCPFGSPRRKTSRIYFLETICERKLHSPHTHSHTHTHTHTHTHIPLLLNEPLRNTAPPSPHPVLTQTMLGHTQTPPPPPHEHTHTHFYFSSEMTLNRPIGGLFPASRWTVRLMRGSSAASRPRPRPRRPNEMLAIRESGQRHAGRYRVCSASNVSNFSFLFFKQLNLRLSWKRWFLSL